MKISKTFLIFALLLSSLNFSFAQNQAVLQPQFNGYMQLRAYSDFGNYYNFSLRRLKLWVKSKPDSISHWAYKVQVVTSSLKNEVFVLEDVKATYHNKNFSINFGQFVPQFSLERFQSDYKLPVLERADVIKRLIPNGTLGVRDIGIEIGWHNNAKNLSSYLGIFNGYGIKQFRLENQGFLLTHKTQLALPLAQFSVKTGYSLQYRQAKNLQLPKILPDTVLFTGKDMRFNLFFMVKSQNLLFQSEYIRAFLNEKTAWGYYFLAAYSIKKSQFVASYGTYHDLIGSTTDLPNFRFGYNYLIKGNKIKLSFDNYFELSNFSPHNYQASVQLQVFLH